MGRQKSRSKHRKSKEKSPSEESHSKNKQQKLSKFINSFQRKDKQNKKDKREQRKTKWSDTAPIQVQQQNQQKELYQKQLYESGLNNPNMPQFEIAGSEGLANEINQLIQINQPNYEKNIIAGIMLPKKVEINKDIIVQHVPPTQFGHSLPAGMSLGIYQALTDMSKYRRKICVPQTIDNRPTNIFSYTGLIIGPKGYNQRKLEEETKCKILVRGRGTHKEGQPMQPDDLEPTYVLIVGDSDKQVDYAAQEILKILSCDEETRNFIRLEQLKLQAKLLSGQEPNQPNYQISIQSSSTTFDNVDLSTTTPYGKPSDTAYIYPIPNDIVGLVIGKNGETIKTIQQQCGADKLSIAAESAKFVKGSTTRNVFIEGSKAAIDKVKKAIQQIIEQRDQQNKQFNGEQELPVPNHLVGLVIGKGGETVKNIHRRTGAHIQIPQECEPGKSDRILKISGYKEQIIQAVNEINEIINKNKMDDKFVGMDNIYEQFPINIQQRQQKNDEENPDDSQFKQQQPMQHSLLFMQTLFQQVNQDVVTESVVDDA